MTEPVDPRPDAHDSPLEAGEVEHFVATAVADAAIAASARRRSLRRQADETDTWAGLLTSLAEAHDGVAVELPDGRRVVGTVELVGDDVVGVRSGAGVQVLVAAGAIGAVRVLASGVTAPRSGDRVVVGGTSLATCVRTLVELRARVRLHAAGATAVAGRLVSCGTDVVVLHSDGDGAQLVVRLGNITDLTVEDRIL